MENTFYFEGQITRLDVFLSEKLNLTRSAVQKLIEGENVTVNEKYPGKSYKLKPNDKVFVSIPEPEPLSVEAEDIPLEIIYEDDYLLVVNKPKGMVVHPAAGNFTGTLVNALLYHCKDSLSGIGGVMRPGIVHRIDKDTSGLLLVAKTNLAHLSLSEQIKNKTVKRSYRAVCHGVLNIDKGKIDAPIGRHHTERKMMTVTSKNSKEAVTHFEVLERFREYTRTRV